MKIRSKLYLSLILAYGSFMADAMEENAQREENQQIQRSVTLCPDALENIFFKVLCFIEKNRDIPKQYLKAIKDQIRTIALVNHSFCDAILNSRYYPLGIMSKNSEIFMTKPYFFISQSRILESHEAEYLFQKTGVKVFSYMNIKLPVGGLNETQLNVLAGCPNLTGTLTGNKEFQNTSANRLPPHIKLITYEESARNNIVVPTYSSYSSVALFSQVDREVPDQRDYLLNLLGQIKKLKIDQETLNNLAKFRLARKDYLIEMVNSLDEDEMTAQGVLALAEVHPSEINSFLEQLRVLNIIRISLESKIECLRAVHPSERDAFVKQIISIKGPVKDYRSLMLQFKDVHPSDWGFIVDDLNRISDAKMYHFSDFSYNKVEKIDDKLVESLNKASQTREEYSKFVPLLLTYLPGEKFECTTLDKLADIHFTELPAFLAQLKDLKKISLSLESKIECLRAVHPSERDAFVNHIVSIKGPAYDFSSIMMKFKDVHPSDRGGFVDDLNRISEAKIYHFKDYSYNMVEKIDGKLVESLKKASQTREGRSEFVTNLLEKLPGEKFDCTTLDMLAGIHYRELSTFLAQLQALKAIPLILECKIDCLRAVYSSERDAFVKHILSIKGPVSDYRSIMRQFKDLHSFDRGAMVDDLNRLGEAKMYYFVGFSYDRVENIDGKLIESLKKASPTREGRTEFVTLLLTHFRGEKFDNIKLDKLSAITPLSKLENTIQVLKSMDSPETLYSRICKIDFKARVN